MKKKIVIILLLFIIITVYFFTTSYAYKQSNYNTYVKTNIKTNLYEKKNNTYNEIGYVGSDILLRLSNNDGNYFLIKDTNYYISSKDVKKSDDYYENISYDKYIPYGNIISYPTILYKYDDIAFNIDKEMKFKILAKDQNGYYVKYLNDIYLIKDNYKMELFDFDSLKSISVLSLECSDEKKNEVFSYINGDYYLININDFKLWIEDKIKLPKNSILVLDNTIVNDLVFIEDDRQNIIGSNIYYKYVIKDDTSIDRVKEMIDGIPLVKASSIPVLNYHFFYDKNSEVCNESICLDINDFKEELDYLNNNGYKTLTMNEFNDWMDKKIELPEKSVLLTIDDGAMGTDNYLPSILEEKKVNATLFLISGWWPLTKYNRSKYLNIESHGHDLHHDDYCENNVCGYKGLVLDKTGIKSDLELSIETIGSNLAFCYPFYKYDEELVESVKETGFKLAFAGGNRKTTRNDDKYKIPRYVIYKNTSINDFINILNKFNS